MDLESVVVTGANRGIGLEFVRQLVHLPNPPKYVFATYRSEGTTQELKNIRDGTKKSEVILIKMDIARVDEIRAARKVIEEKLGKNGRLTLLINNAGVCTHHAFTDLKEDHLLSHYLPNSVGPVLLFQELYPLLQAAADKKAGSPQMGVSRAAVVNITAALGSVTIVGTEEPKMHSVISYRMSKAALNIGMRVIASQLDEKDKGILIVLMCPGWVKTDMGSPFAELEVSDSVSTMMKTMSQLNEKHQGAFIHRDGKAIPF